MTTILHSTHALYFTAPAFPKRLLQLCQIGYTATQELFPYIRQEMATPPDLSNNLKKLLMGDTYTYAASEDNSEK